MFHNEKETQCKHVIEPKITFRNFKNYQNSKQMYDKKGKCGF